MMDSPWETQGCVVCRTSLAKVLNDTNNRRFDCPRCGDFVISHEAYVDELDNSERSNFWAPARRAALSYRIRLRRDLPCYRETNFPYLTAKSLNELIGLGLELPLPLQQAKNLLRIIGGFQRANGESKPNLSNKDVAIVGATNEVSLLDLAADVRNIGWLVYSDGEPLDKNNPRALPKRPVSIRLTLEGWRVWEEQQSGNQSSSDGFIAMQFGNDRLDNIIGGLVQGRVANELGVAIHRLDSPGKTRSGLIDNNMREAIEDAAFVLVELSHGNRGAYWEAGLAEGLRKPVIYLCEQAAWDDPDRRPHFDVNHRTTIMWDEAEPDKFVESLVATIRNSLRHHGLEKGRATE